MLLAARRRVSGASQGSGVAQWWFRCGTVVLCTLLTGVWGQVVRGGGARVQVFPVKVYR